MKKDDNISIILSIVINIIILLLIPKFSVKEVINKKIKVGLIAYDNNKKTKLEGKNNSNTKEKKVVEKITKPKVEKKNPPKVVKKEVKNKVDLAALNDVAKTIATPTLDVLGVENSPRQSSNIKVPTKKFEGLKTPVLETSQQNLEDIVLEKEPIPEKIENLDLTPDKLSFNSQNSEDIKFDRILDPTEINEGLPSGYKLGTEDGDIVAKWDNTNREPVYPEIAQVKGLHGTVKIKMSIDENGEVKTIDFEKGSGVPEINNAIEQVARTWRIHLSKNGLSVPGNVLLEYKFVLN